MAVETKMGMCIVVILVSAFGFLLYHKFDLKQRELLQASMQGKQSDLETPGSDAASSPVSEESQPLPDTATFQPPPSTDGIVETDSFGSTANGFGNEANRNPLAATEIRPEFNLTEPGETGLETKPGPDADSLQTPSSDPFAALAAQNAARQAREAQTARTSTDDPFASIPTPAPQQRRLFSSAPSADGSPASTDPKPTDTPAFPTFGDAEPADTLDSPAFADAGSDALDFSTTSPASTPEPRPLPPAFPAFDSSSNTADAAAGRDLPPVSSLDALSSDRGTAVREAAQPLRPVDDSSRQLIAMLEPQPDVDPFIDDRPVTKPAPVLFSVSDEDDSAPANSSTTATAFNNNARIHPFGATDDAITNAAEAVRGDTANPFVSNDAASQPKTGSRFPSTQNATVAPATGEIEFGVARFHNPRQIQQVAGTAEPCDICEVKLNDNYWTISKRTYGTARYFSSLALYNRHRISDPKKLRPGMKVLIPDPSVLEERYPEFFRGQQRKPAQPTGYFLRPDGSPAYRIGDRETLSEISQKHLGRASRWIQIYRLNQQILKDPNRLKLGTVIVLPDDATDVHLAP